MHLNKIGVNSPFDCKAIKQYIVDAPKNDRIVKRKKFFIKQIYVVTICFSISCSTIFGVVLLGMIYLYVKKTNSFKRIIKMETFWFAARTIACAEINMRNFLQKCNIECFVPVKLELVKKKDTVIEKEVPLINNLIFFKSDYATANSLFSQYNRKIFCIRNKQGLITIPEQEMEQFILFVNHYKSKVVVNPVFVLGDKVKVKSGPFAGVEGYIIEVNKKNHFTLVLGELLTVSVKFPKSNLIKIKI